MPEIDATALALSKAGPPQPDVDVRIRVPDVRLQSFVTFYYEVRCAGALTDFLYPEWGNVRFARAGSWWVESREVGRNVPVDGALFGPTDRAMKVVSESGVTLGFGLTPLGWERLLGLTADAFANRVVRLGDLLGPVFSELNERLTGKSGDSAFDLLDTVLLDRLQSCAANPSASIAVDIALRARPTDVRSFARAASMDTRALSRLCKRVFGFGPKRLIRRQRFLDTLGMVRITEQPNFSALSDPDYVDRSHFNHEFHEFMGLSPTGYLATPRPLMGQAASIQLQEGIPLSFKLPEPPGNGLSPQGG